MTAVLAIAVLWLLARIRFPDRPATPNPIAPVLTQLVRGPTFDALASELSRLQPRLASSLLTSDVATPWPRPALRIQEDVALTLVPAESESRADQGLLARDPASGLALVRVPAAAVVRLMPWVPRHPQPPRFLIATDVLGPGVSLRPVFIGGLDPVESPTWSGTVWTVPVGADVLPGSFLFTNDAEFAGLVVQHLGGLAIVPSETLLAEADRLRTRTGERAGDIGVQVQSLTPSVSSATGATTGVVVTWVDARGGLADRLSVGDVIESFDGQAVATPQHWDVRVARLFAGDTLALQVRRRGALQNVQVIAPGRPAQSVDQSLGLGMRRMAPIGTQVVRVDLESVAARSGLVTGDIITLVGDISAPTPAQVRNTFAAAPARQPVLIAVTRGETHSVMTLTK